MVEGGGERSLSDLYQALTTCLLSSIVSQTMVWETTELSKQILIIFWNT